MFTNIRSSNSAVHSCKSSHRIESCNRVILYHGKNRTDRNGRYSAGCVLLYSRLQIIRSDRIRSRSEIQDRRYVLRPARILHRRTFFTDKQDGSGAFHSGPMELPEPPAQGSIHQIEKRRLPVRQCNRPERHHPLRRHDRR